MSRALAVFAARWSAAVFVGPRRLSRLVWPLCETV
jgi:hypothetical protein